MSKTTKLTLILTASALLVGFFAGLFTHSRYQALHTPEPKVDTVYVPKSAEIFGPSPIESVPRPDLPPAVVPIKDVKVSEDSTSVSIEKETVTYRDTLAQGVVATAIITGVQPSLDHLHITWPETTITKTNYKPLDGWALGLSVSGAYAVTPFVTSGATVSYTAGPARFRLDAGVLYSPTGQQKVSPYVGGGIELTMFRFRK